MKEDRYIPVYNVRYPVKDNGNGNWIYERYCTTNFEKLMDKIYPLIIDGCEIKIWVGWV